MREVERLWTHTIEKIGSESTPSTTSRRSLLRGALTAIPQSQERGMGGSSLPAWISRTFIRCALSFDRNSPIECVIPSGREGQRCYSMFPVEGWAPLSSNCSLLPRFGTANYWLQSPVDACRQAGVGVLHAAEQTAKRSSLAPHLFLSRPGRSSTMPFAASVDSCDSFIFGVFFNIWDPSVEILLHQTWLK